MRKENMKRYYKPADSDDSNYKSAHISGRRRINLDDFSRADFRNMYAKEKAILVEEVSSDEENSTEYGNSVDPN